jgi:hypothetical protein
MKITGRLLPFALLAVFLAGKNVQAEVAVGTPVLGPAPHNKIQPAVAGNGQDFFVVWRDARTGNSEEILGSRVSAEGVVLDPTGIRLGSAPVAQSPRVLWAGDSWFVIWNTQSSQDPAGHLWLTRVNRDGSIAAPPRVIANGHSMQGSYAAANGSRVVALYHVLVDVRTTIRAVVLDTSGNTVADHQLAPSDIGRYYLSIAASSSGFLAVWNSFPTAQSQIEGVRLDATGKPLDAQPRLLATSYDPELASDGTNFLLIARNPTNPNSLTVGARAVRADLLQVGSVQPLPSGEALYTPSVLRVGSDYLVVARRVTGTLSTIEATRLDEEGAVVAQSEALATFEQPSLDPEPVAAANGQDLLVVWIEQDPNFVDATVRAQLVSAASLTPRGSAFTVTASAPLQESAAIAFDGHNHLVVWRERTGLYATRVTLDGRSLDGRGLQLTAAYPGDPRVVFDGTQYVVAWTEPRTGPSGDTRGVVARFVAPQTGSLSPALRIATYPGMQVALATNGESTLLAWSGGFESRNVYAIRIGRESQQFEGVPVLLSPPGQVAENPAAAWNGSTFLVAWSEFDLEADLDVVFYVPVRIRGTRVSTAFAPLDPASILLADAPGSDGAPALASAGTEWLLSWASNEIRIRRIAATGTPEGTPEGRVVAAAGDRPAVTFDGARYVLAWRNQDEIHLAYVTPAGVPSGSQVLRIAPEQAGSPVGVSAINRGVASVVYTRVSWAPEHGGVSRVFLQNVTQGMKSRSVR